MSFEVHVEYEAEEDITQAYYWYEEKQSGLGDKFLQCLRDTFQHIGDTPEIHAVIHKNIRQTLVRRFPFVVCYTYHDECVFIVAVFHGHRDPNVWESRI